MDHGNIVQFDEPEILKNDAAGFFAQMQNKLS